MWDGPDDQPDVVDPTGLGGVDLTLGCPSASQAVAFGVGEGQPPDNDVNVTLTLYTNASDFSSLTQLIEEGASRAVVFDFDDANWQDTGNGVTFSNVGAIELEFDPQADAVDFTIDTPITACGIDFGDAPDDLADGAQFGDSVFTKQS